MNHKSTLAGYVIGVLVALVITNVIVYATGGPSRLRMVTIFSLGFLAGMTSMYIKSRLMLR